MRSFLKNISRFHRQYRVGIGGLVALAPFLLLFTCK
jgi:hypothetical protein